MRWDLDDDRYQDATHWRTHPRETRLVKPPTICATEGCENQADGEKYCVRCVRAQCEHLQRVTQRRAS